MAESVLTLAQSSSGSIVMVKVDPVEDSSQPSNTPALPLGPELYMHTSNQSSLYQHIPSEASILEAITPPDMPGAMATEEATVEVAAEEEDATAAGNRNMSQTEAMSEASRTAASNPMSVSVPNLTSNMEQTVSLLESFAAVARRNLGNVANPMGRSNNASSLVRLALSSNVNGM